MNINSNYNYKNECVFEAKYGEMNKKEKKTRENVINDEKIKRIRKTETRAKIKKNVMTNCSRSLHRVCNHFTNPGPDKLNEASQSNCPFLKKVIVSVLPAKTSNRLSTTFKVHLLL